MKYYRLNDDIHSPKHRHLGNVLQQNVVVDAEHFTSSRRYAGSSDLLIEAAEGQCFDFCLAAFDVPVISERFAEVLRPIAKDDIQLIPLKISNEASYFIMNSLRRLPCLDESRSIFSKWQAADGRPDRTGQYRMVVELRVSSNLIGNSNVFRIDGWDVPLIVSDSIRQGFLDNSFCGGVFEPVS